MGLFSFVGKALKGISKVAGFIPGVGGTVSKITGTIGGVLDHKKPMSKPMPMVNRPALARGNAVQWGAGWTAQVLRSTPVMPGGAISTPSGIYASNGSAPPAAFGGTRAAPKKRRTVKRRKARAAPKRRTRRLKFGSAAWRKKYMKKRARR